MTITYNGHTYSHQQIWALVEAMGSRGTMVRTQYGAGNAHEVWLIWYTPEHRHIVRGVGEYGDRTPFRALCRAIGHMQMRQGGAS